MATIEDVINFAQNNVTDAVAGSELFVDELRQAISWEGMWAPGTIDPGVQTNVITRVNYTAPSLTTLPLAGESAPEQHTPATVIASLAAVTVPTFDSVAPVLSMPERPDATLPDAPTGAPEFTAPVIPDKPAVALPDLPTFNPVTIPSPPNIEIPTWSETAPVDDLLLPTHEFTWSETVYTSELLDTAKGIIQHDLENGGYGLDPRDETALWERARDREMKNADAAMQQFQRSMAARGFSIPPGAYQAGVMQLQQDARAKVSDLNRDISLKRADLYVQNRQFMLTTGLQAEQFLIAYHAGLAERALNAAKYVFEAGTVLYDMQVKRFNARLQLYQITAQVYESQIRAALGRAEIYRAEIEAARLTVSMNESVVELYRAQLAGIESVINIYRTEMEAANVHASIEKLRLEAFRERVDAYAAQVRAKSEEFGMYEAAVRGELAKVDVYRNEVQAFDARVNAARTQKEIHRIDAQHQIEVGRLRLSELEGQLTRYREVLNGNLATARLLLEKHGIDVRIWDSQVQAAIKDADFQLEKWVKETSANLDASRIRLQELQAIASNDHNITSEGIAAAGKALDMYQRIVESSSNSLSAITTLAE
jgi:hypothetical protein